ncbi:MAG: hypothetical protein ACOYZ8_16765 [Chloroflexota bacterium]
MIGAHAAGIISSYKSLNKTPAKCLVCGEYSECQITKYEKALHLFFVEVRILDEQFLFDWEKCKHRAILFDKQDVSRYKQEQVETGIMLVPYYQGMKLQMTSTPHKRPMIQLVLVITLALILGLVVGFLIEMILDRLGIPFVL